MMTSLSNTTTFSNTTTTTTNKSEPFLEEKDALLIAAALKLFSNYHVRALRKTCLIIIRDSKSVQNAAAGWILPDNFPLIGGKFGKF